MEYQLINGKVLRTEEALIPLNDLGLLRGYSVFDYFRVLQGVPVFIEDHVERLYQSTARIDLDLNWTADEIKQMCHDLVAANGGPTVNAGMRIVVTGGFASDGFTPTDSNIFITLHPLPTYAPTDYTAGRGLLSSNYTRSMAEIKTTIYGHVISLRKKMKEANAIEALYHSDGLITECSRANIFFVTKDNRIITPASNLLRGITRKHVIRLAAEASYPVIEEDIYMADLHEMKEAFISSTTKGVMPIVKVDDIFIGNGAVGEVSIVLRNAFLKLIDNYIASHQQNQQVIPEV